jgi:hypothetical protein
MTLIYVVSRAKLARRRDVMTIRKKLAVMVCMGFVVIVLGACKQEGPAERTGREIDEAAEKLGEAVEKKGPSERAGESIDDAVNNAGEALEEAGEKVKKATD